MPAMPTAQNLRRASVLLSRLAGLVPTPTLHGQRFAWDQAGPLMVANIARLALSTTQLQPKLYYESAILCRSLFEHVATFCWIAIDPSLNFERWRKTDLDYREKTLNDAKARAVPKLTHVKRHLKPDVAAIPKLDAMCVEVDRHWGARLKEFGGGRPYELRSIYTVLYRYYSAATHGQGLALQTLIKKTSAGKPVVDLSAPELAHSVLVAPPVFGLALFVSAEVLGFPDRSAIHSIFQQAKGR